MFDEDKQRAQLLIELFMGGFITLILVYFCGYLALYLGAGHNLIEAFSWVGYKLSHFHIVYNPLKPGVTSGWLTGLVAGAIITWMLHLDRVRHMVDSLSTSKGDAHFQTKRERKIYNEKFLTDDNGEVHINDEKDDHIILSDTYRRPVRSWKITGNNNVAVVGTAGSGKSRGYIIPNLLQVNSSYVVTDPSGEVLATVGNLLLEHGYRIKLFNTSEMQYSNRYNPLKYIRDDTGVSMVIQCLIDNTSGKGKKGDEFWTNAEKLLYHACIFYLLEFCQDESKRNFASVMSMINSSAVDENDASKQSELDELFDSIPDGSLAKKYYRSFKQAAGKTLKSIIISCVTRLQAFMTPQVVNLTKYDNLELEKLGDEKTALFIITPQADRTFAFLSAMLYNQIFETLYHKGEQQKADGGSERLKYPVQCLMDEFANIGEIPEFQSKLATMRKYNINATVVLQDTSQLESLFEKADAQTIMGNCSTIIFLGSSEHQDLKFFSEMLGKKTIMTRSRNTKAGKGASTGKSYQVDSRELMTPDEIGAMPTNMCLVFSYANRPVYDKKYDMTRHHHWDYISNKDHQFKYKEIDEFNTNSLETEGGMMAGLRGAARVEAEFRRGNAAGENGAIKLSEQMHNRQAVVDRLNADKETEEKLIQRDVDMAVEAAIDQDDMAVVVLQFEQIPHRRMILVGNEVGKRLDSYPVIVAGGRESDGSRAVYVADKARGCVCDFASSASYLKDVKTLGASLMCTVHESKLQKLAEDLHELAVSDLYCAVYGHNAEDHIGQGGGE